LETLDERVGNVVATMAGSFNVESEGEGVENLEVERRIPEGG